MIPYFEIVNFSLGPLIIHMWGLMVGIGILAGVVASTRLARARGLDSQVIWDITPWIVFGAFVGARLFHVLFYESAFYFANPLQILMIWNGGLSISGGLIGALAIGVWMLKKKKVDVLRYAEMMVFGLPLGTFIGRLGCFFTHMHPGRPTSFVLGVTYPDGIVRHDLGLYLSLDGLVLFVVFLFLKTRKIPQGTLIALYLTWYGTTRFILDFYRATDGTIVDARYAGLTPAQYLSIALLIAGVYAFLRIAKRNSIW